MRILIIGQLKNRKTGLGKAINDLYDFLKVNNNYVTNKLDITNNKKIFKNIMYVIRTDFDRYYFTPSGSFFGNIRDSLYLFIMIIKKKKIICHFHNSNFGNTINKNKILFLLNKYIYNHVNKIIILGNKQKNMFLNMNIKEEVFKIIPNGVDSSLFIENGELCDKNKCSKKNVAYFSNMIIDKGYLDVLEVAKKLNNNNDFHFYFSGKFFNENLKEEFLNSIINLKNVTYYDGLYGDEKKIFLKKMHYFILPSKYKDETLPISMLEAISNASYIIISNIGVIEEYINNDTTCLLNNNDNNLDKIVEILLTTKNILGNLNFNIDYYKENFDNNIIQEKIAKEICY